MDWAALPEAQAASSGDPAGWDEAVAIAAPSPGREAEAEQSKKVERRTLSTCIGTRAVG
jgi:hypothetical protein